MCVTSDASLVSAVNGLDTLIAVLAEARYKLFACVIVNVMCSTGGMEVVESLLQDPGLQKQKNAVEALEEMRLLLKYCQLYGVADKVSILVLVK